MTLSKGFVAGIAVALVAVTSVGSAADQEKPMHMHKSQMDHSKKDAEVATEYRTEAQELRAKAEQHRKLAELYKSRTPVKGGGNFSNVAKHCEKLAKFYEDAAAEAEGVAKELGKP